jgi:hypothetical protein
LGAGTVEDGGHRRDSTRGVAGLALQEEAVGLNTDSTTGEFRGHAWWSINDGELISWTFWGT